MWVCHQLQLIIIKIQDQLKSDKRLMVSILQCVCVCVCVYVYVSVFVHIADVVSVYV